MTNEYDSLFRNVNDMTKGASSSLPTRSGESKREIRQRVITQQVVANGQCTAQELADEFGVSLMTIHRDLDQLERRGLVRKFHGGVTAQPSGVFEAQLSYRMMNRSREKAAIAKAGLKYIEPGMSIMLDDSTTVLQMISGLAEFAPLHVVTTFLTGLRRLSELSAEADITFIGLGGLYDVPHDSFVGMQTIEQIAGIRTDAIFMSTSSVSESAAFHQEQRIVALKRAMLEAATKRYLLVDHTKLNKVALHQIVPLDQFDLIITDSDVPDSLLKAWDSAGIPYEIATP